MIAIDLNCLKLELSMLSDYSIIDLLDQEEAQRNSLRCSVWPILDFSMYHCKFVCWAVRYDSIWHIANN